MKPRMKAEETNSIMLLTSSDLTFISYRSSQLAADTTTVQPVIAITTANTHKSLELTSQNFQEL